MNPVNQLLPREFREEIGAEVAESQLLAVFECLFEYNGTPGHEIVFLYDVTLANRELYDLEEITVKEGASVRTARWYSKTEMAKCVVLPPLILEHIG